MLMMRDNRESVVAVLEAFVYDPLINWRYNCAPQHRLALAAGTPRCAA
jgi:phosphatidylinositol kinase/protein kinase (PI-3  family)